MLINSILCADCDEIMSTYELHDFYCESSKLVLQIEERVCLQCNAAVWQLVNIMHADQNFDTGRSESLEVTLTREKVERKLSPAKINKLMHLYFLERIRNICLNRKGFVWYNAFEIQLWEAMRGLNDHGLELTHDEMLSLNTISEHLNTWMINPADWAGLEKHSSPFINLRAWKRLYANRATLFKLPASHEHQYDTRNASADPEP